MRNPSLTLLGLASLSSALLVGCGGGGSNGGSTPASSAQVTGGASMATKTNVSEIPSSNAPASHDFGGTTAVIPAGITIPANSTVAIVGTSRPVLGLQGSGAFNVNGVATGITLNNGSLSSSVALPPTTGGSPYAIAAVAPAGGFLIPSSGARAFSGLTINTEFVLGVPVLPNGTAGFPTNVSGTIPTNGSNAGNVSLNVFYPQAFAGYGATLSISWKVGKDTVTIEQTKTVAASGVVNFTAKSAHAIPSTGVDTISLVLNSPH